MTFSKIVSGAYIVAVVKTNGGDGNITEAEYNGIRSAISRIPERREGYALKLRASTLEWEYVPVAEPVEPEDPDLSAEEALDIITGGDSDEAE